jgi:hypothetical protein
MLLPILACPPWPSFPTRRRDLLVEQKKTVSPMRTIEAIQVSMLTLT